MLRMSEIEARLPHSENCPAPLALFSTNKWSTNSVETIRLDADLVVKVFYSPLKIVNECSLRRENI